MFITQKAIHSGSYIKSTIKNVFLGVRTVGKNCCRCQQRLGSCTDNSLLYDTDYYQEDDAKQI